MRPNSVSIGFELLTLLLSLNKNAAFLQDSFAFRIKTVSLHTNFNKNKYE